MTTIQRLTWLVAVTLFILSCESTRPEKRILVFTKNSIGKVLPKRSIESVSRLCVENGIKVDTTSDGNFFHEDSLRQYSAILFLNTVGDVLDYRQQADFKRYIQSGGGFVGVHSAAATEYRWPWYNQLVGAYFDGQSIVKEAEIRKKVAHPSTAHLSEQWTVQESWYTLREAQEGLQVLLELDNSNPISWFREFDGGRSWFTALGYSSDMYQDPLFLQHLMGGIQYAIGSNTSNDFSKATEERVPEAENFVKHVLAEKLDEPMELTVLPDGQILFVERRGDIHLFDPNSESLSLAGHLDVYDGYEDGMLGLTHDPEFPANNWIYIYYSPAGSDSIQRLSRFTFSEKEVDLSSESIMLEIPSQRKECCHSGGSLAFDGNGLLYLSLGDNTNPLTYSHYDRDHIFAPHDERPGREPWDAQRTAGNTNDLRGGIIRIKPQADGSYSIPDGNLYPEGEKDTRPEIYVLGARNPFRISVDKKTGYLYYGEVGTDTGADSERGPKGYDEFNQVREAGYFGWPYVVANNIPYSRYNWSTGELGETFNPEGPINVSVNNTGKQDLPPAKPAMIWYPYEISEVFPSLGKGGRNAMAGPVYYSEDYPENKRRFPSYYDGKWFIYEWMRNWIKVVTFDEKGDYLEIEPFLPGLELSSPMDMEFGYDGALYFLEYGTNWFTGNDDARLVRLDYNDQNRLPVAKIVANNNAGALPLNVNLSSEGSFDFDKEDVLTYSWNIDGTPVSTDPAFEYEFIDAGVYNIQLTVTDSKGESSQKSISIAAGNDPPVIDMTFGSNQSFYRSNKPFSYKVLVEDLEDGNSTDEDFNIENLKVNVAYLEGVKPNDGYSVSLNPNREGMLLIDGSDCKSCHSIGQMSVGPSYQAVAERYKDQEEALQNLSEKIIKGGGGNWGDHSMAAHPQFSMDEARAIVRYILSINEGAQSIDPAGNLTPSSSNGLYVFEVNYMDTGANGLDPIEVSKRFVLRPSRVELEDCDSYQGIVKERPSSTNYMLVSTVTNPATMIFNQLDINGFSSIRLRVSSENSGNILEVRSGTLNGEVLAEVNIPNTKDRLSWTEIETSIGSVKTINDLVFVMKNPDNSLQENLFNLDWIELLP